MASEVSADFEARVLPFRSELHAFCYRMLGSVQDADDALQEALLGAWRGLDGFEGRSSLRSWLYRVAHNACLKLLSQRTARLLPLDHSPASDNVDVGPLINEPIWLEPYPTPTDASYEQLESVELAFVAALQHLPPNQRAALILRDVLGFESAETADLLDTSVASITSALQRARQTVESRVPPITQQATLRALGADAQQKLVESFVSAWARSDADALIQLLREDVRFSMPPIPTWFDGRANVGRFLKERVLKFSWRLVPLRASGQLAFACYQSPDFRLGALNVVTLQGGEILEMTGFLDPALHRKFSLPER